MFSAVARPLQTILLFSIFVLFSQNAMATDIPLQENFDLTQYLGRWFENYRTKNIRFESGTDIQAIYTAKPDSTVNVTNKQYFPDKQEWNQIEGTAKVVDPKVPARFGVKFFWWQPSGDYRVLYTDYKNIAVVYSEFSLFGLWTSKSAWILGRVQNLPQDRIDQAFALLKERVGLDQDQFLKTPTGKAPNLD